jgi:hypothetical protein
VINWRHGEIMAQNVRIVKGYLATIGANKVVLESVAVALTVGFEACDERSNRDLCNQLARVQELVEVRLVGVVLCAPNALSDLNNGDEHRLRSL